MIVEIKKKKDSNKKEDKSCDYCKRVGHTRDSCFKNHGYPKWYKQLIKEKGSSSKVQVNMENDPLEEEHALEKKGGGTKISHALPNLMQREVSRILKGEQAERINFAHIPEYASSLCLEFDTGLNMPNDCWIIDLALRFYAINLMMTNV